ncbi:response regulator [Actinomadura flavalba]|uniref:response regulator n=1 Tax=Actinomadura flavalba TaxID=1120938 RepID=UPI00039B8BBF|nr:response regulator transcription factor [Actinomadura flavalba]
MIRVLIAQDVHLFRSGLVALLAGEPDLTVTATVGGDGLATACREHAPDLVLLDIDLAGADGIAAIASVHEAAPDCAVVIMADLRRTGDLRRAVTAGARGFVLKDSSPAELVDALRRVARGERVLDAELAYAELAAARSPLTPRELDVLKAMAAGGTVSEIAGQLYLSSGTVRNYLARILAKLGARTRVEAVTMARGNGWLHHETSPPTGPTRRRHIAQR